MNNIDLVEYINEKGGYWGTRGFYLYLSDVWVRINSEAGYGVTLTFENFIVTEAAPELKKFLRSLKTRFKISGNNLVIKMIDPKEIETIVIELKEVVNFDNKGDYDKLNKLETFEVINLKRLSKLSYFFLFFFCLFWIIVALQNYHREIVFSYTQLYFSLGTTAYLTYFLRVRFGLAMLLFVKDLNYSIPFLFLMLNLTVLPVIIIIWNYLFY